MKTEKFERKIMGLSQIEILSGAVGSLNRLLVDKGIVSKKELREYFQKRILEYSPEKSFEDMSLKENVSSPKNKRKK